ncbi:MAG TPA: hypothetical protein VNC12_01545 [Solirubrobacteraceae bacterium]|nr:hypothetical protein [Solirubrobacteraceae bacterium]
MRRARRARGGRSLRLASLPAGVAAVVILLAAGASAAPNPPGNIRLGSLPRNCDRAPTGVACETASVRALDAARARLGLGPYLLPADFIALAPARQWLILANLDRIAYSLRPIDGLSAVLNTIARRGAAGRQDPDPGPLLMSLHGQSRIGFASNWAGGQPNALVAYYGWMYDDGYGSGNLDCRTPSAPGCWGHRQDILAFPAAGRLSMGAAAVRGSASYALTIVETSTAAWPYSYTWAAAMAGGAGVRRSADRRGPTAARVTPRGGRRSAGADA